MKEWIDRPIKGYVTIYRANGSIYIPVEMRKHIKTPFVKLTYDLKRKLIGIQCTDDGIKVVDNKFIYCRKLLKLFGISSGYYKAEWKKDRLIIKVGEPREKPVVEYD